MISIRIPAKESCLTKVIVKMSTPKVEIAVLKNLLFFGEKSLPQSVRLLFGRMPFEHAVSLSGASLTQLDHLLYVNDAPHIHGTCPKRETLQTILILALHVQCTYNCLFSFSYWISFPFFQPFLSSVFPFLLIFCRPLPLKNFANATNF